MNDDDEWPSHRFSSLLTDSGIVSHGEDCCTEYRIENILATNKIVTQFGIVNLIKPIREISKAVP